MAESITFAGKAVGLKILWIHERMGSMGGAESNVLASAAALAGRGHRNVLLFREATGRDEAAWDEAFETIERVGNGHSLAERAAAHEPDVVWIHNWPDFEDFPALIAGGAPVARMIHDHATTCLRTYKYHPLTRRNCARPTSLACLFPCGAIVRRGAGRFPVIDPGSYFRKLREIAVNRTLGRVVVASGFMRDELLRNRFDGERVEVLTPVPPESVVGAGGPESGRLLFVGQMIRGKGLDVLLEALAGVSSGWHLDVAGDGTSREKLIAQSLDLGIADRVTFHGHLSPPELAELYAKAQVVVFPSMWPEPFGLVGIEAMRVGRPVVAFDVGGVSEWLQDGVSGLLVPWGDRVGLAAAIVRLIESPGEAERMGAAGRAISEERFSFERYVSRLERFLDQLAREAPAGHHV